MFTKFALPLALVLLPSTVLHAETYNNPDRTWWARYLSIVDGTVPDFEAMAKLDLTYLSADEFTRAEVLDALIADFQAQLGQIDVGAAEITVSIRATLGEYSVKDGGFPVNLFTPGIHLPLDANKLFFRNSGTYRIFPATPDEGRALRERIGSQPLAADVTITDVAKSTTRPRSYEGFVTHVVYTLRDGLVIGAFDDVETAPPSAETAASSVDRVRGKIVDMAAIPPLGTSWSEAKAMIQTNYPFNASDDFSYSDRGKVIAYDYETGTLVMDADHEPDRTFRVYLQQVDGAWRTKAGFSVDLNAIDTISTKGTGPGLACYTPDVRDRCAVLEFSPSTAGHTLTRAYGVIELDRTGTPEEMLTAFLGEDATVFDLFAAPVDYDAEAVKLGETPRFVGARGVRAHIGGAGEQREGNPIYDPLENTSGLNPIAREIALFALDGTPGRVPLIFVLQ